MVLESKKPAVPLRDSALAIHCSPMGESYDPTGGIPIHCSPEFPIHRSPTGEFPIHRSPTGEFPIHRSPTGEFPIHRSPTGEFPIHRSPTGEFPIHHSPTGEFSQSPTEGIPTYRQLLIIYLESITRRSSFSFVFPIPGSSLFQ